MTQRANGSAPPPAPPVPPIDPGNLFVLQRLEAHDVEVTVREVVEQPRPCQQTSIGASLPGSSTRVLVTTWRSGPATLTAMLRREDAVAAGRQLTKAAASLAPQLVLSGPLAATTARSLEVVVEVEGSRIRMVWSRDDASNLGAALVRAAQSMGGIITPAPGVQP